MLCRNWGLRIVIFAVVHELLDHLVYPLVVLAMCRTMKSVTHLAQVRERVSECVSGWAGGLWGCVSACVSGWAGGRWGVRECVREE